MSYILKILVEYEQKLNLNIRITGNFGAMDQRRYYGGTN